MSLSNPEWIEDDAIMNTIILDVVDTEFGNALHKKEVDTGIEYLEYSDGTKDFLGKNND